MWEFIGFLIGCILILYILGRIVAKITKQHDISTEETIYDGVGATAMIFGIITGVFFVGNVIELLSTGYLGIWSVVVCGIPAFLICGGWYLIKPGAGK